MKFLEKIISYYYIVKSKLFDANYYLRTYPDVREADIDPIWHYILFGCKQGKNPNCFFNTIFYRTHYPDVQLSRLNPLVHYYLIGKKENRAFSSEEETIIQKQLSYNDLNYFPKVSIIVPCYNHEKYLAERLNSIYNQTYKNVEVILLDDFSTDNSRLILDRYYVENRNKTIKYFNEVNSGSPFAQWKKGLSLATGELIWIAESDDYCDTDFLTKLVSYFQDDAVLLGYAHTKFVDESGVPNKFTFENYLKQTLLSKWDHSYVETAHNEVKTCLGYINTIPNVSSVIFRKPNENFPLYKDNEWEKMQVCGDWLFYLYIIRGGKIAYCADTTDYFRRYSKSSSAQYHVKIKYFEEHAYIAETIASLYKVDDELLIRGYEKIKKYYLSKIDNPSEEDFNKIYDIKKIIAHSKGRKPNVLMGLYSFILGGGEIYPIILANAMHEIGLSVTVFNWARREPNVEIRQMLHPNIAVINYSDQTSIDQIIKDYGIDIIHTHHKDLDLFFAKAKSLKPEIKHVITMHGMYEVSYDFKSNIETIMKSVSVWFYIADKNIKPFVKYKLYTQKMFIKIYNGMPRPDPKPVELEEFGIKEDSIVTIIASRAMEQKGWNEAIEAVKITRERTGFDIHLFLLGSGPLYDRLKEKVLPPYIHLLGYKQNVDDYIAQSNIGMMVSYSKSESFPLITLQYLMAGIPIISTNIGESKEIISYGEEIAGELIQLRNGHVNPEEIADALTKLLLDKDYYNNCSQIAAKISQRYDIIEVAKQYLLNYPR